MKTLQAIFSSLLLSCASLVSAHPGHGMGEGHGSEILHPFLGPYPLSLMAAVGVLYLLRRTGTSGDTSDRDQE